MPLSEYFHFFWNNRTRQQIFSPFSPNGLYQRSINSMSKMKDPKGGKEHVFWVIETIQKFIVYEPISFFFYIKWL